MEVSPQSNQRPGASPGSPQTVAREAASTVREQAGAMAHDTKDAARSMIGEQQQAAASGLGDFAGALRRAAHDMDGGRSGSASRLAESAADNLQRFSETLRNKDLDSVLREAESFARRQPIAFIGAAAVVGFLAVRFLKASHADEAHTGSSGGYTGTPSL